MIANAGNTSEETHPIVIEGQGHTSLVNVEAFSGDNGALTNLGESYDFMLVKGSERLTISLFGCRMRNYTASQPITIRNPTELNQAVACVNHQEEPFNLRSEERRVGKRCV